MRLDEKEELYCTYIHMYLIPAGLFFFFMYETFPGTQLRWFMIMMMKIVLSREQA